MLSRIHNVEHSRLEFSTTTSIRDKSLVRSLFLSCRAAYISSSRTTAVSILMSNSITANACHNTGPWKRTYANICEDLLYTSSHIAHEYISTHHVEEKDAPHLEVSHRSRCIRIISPGARRYVTRDIYRSGLNFCQRRARVKYAGNEKSEREREKILAM